MLLLVALTKTIPPCTLLARYNEQVLSLSVQGMLDELYEHHFAGSAAVGSRGSSPKATLDKEALAILLGFIVVYVISFVARCATTLQNCVSRQCFPVLTRSLYFLARPE